jgi:hypothetical protein
VWSLAYLEAAKSSAVVLRMSSCSDVVIRARGCSCINADAASSEPTGCACLGFSGSCS